ncbi:MAG: hypothetical protein OSJ76_06690 [Alphaproteobacteria bacterium]|nr:hypothetical protein [Alphaproteobacteria bacterium]
MEKDKTPLEQLTAFCNACWDFESDVQQQKYDELCAAFTQLSVKEKREIIPLLVDKSAIYPQLVFLAKKLFDTLDFAEKSCLTIHLVSPTDMSCRRICPEEYLWRKKHHFSCWQEQGGYWRPVSAIDVMTFQDEMAMIVATNSPVILLCG